MGEMMDLRVLWNEVIQRLQDHYQLPRVSMGFVLLARPTGQTDQHLILEVPSSLVRDRLETHMRQELAAAVTDVLGKEMQLIFSINPDLDSIATNDEPPVSAPAEPQPEITQREPLAKPTSQFTAPPSDSSEKPPSRLNPKYTFDSFVTGASNRFAQAAATAVAESPADTYNPLFIYGGSGLGKTHLLHAIGNYARKLFDGIRVTYVNSEVFTNEFINSIRDQTPETFQRRYRNVDILLIDDIQFLSGKEQTMEEFFHTFNALHNDRKQIVITSDTPPKQLAKFEERLVSRFESGLLTDVQPPDLETRIAILRKKAAAERIAVDGEVLEYIGTRIFTNIRELEGALIRVTAFANLTDTNVDLPLAEMVLKDLITDPHGQEITPSMIITHTAQHLDIPIEALRSQDRSRNVVSARQIAMYLCRELTELSLPKIGDAFARDHTTVMHACKKITQEMAKRPEIYQQVKDLTNAIRNQAMQGNPR